MNDFLKVWRPDDEDPPKAEADTKPVPRESAHVSDMRELHAKYCEFRSHLPLPSGGKIPVRAFADFCAWFMALAPHVQAASRERYTKGYDAMIAQGRADIDRCIANTPKHQEGQ